LQNAPTGHVHDPISAPAESRRSATRYGAAPITVALAESSATAPALFIAGERYRGELRAAPVLAAVESALSGA